MSQAFQGDKTALKFQEMTEHIEDAMNKIPYAELGISDEVREQVRVSIACSAVKVGGWAL